MIIRLATAADLPAILALEQSSPTAAHWPEPNYAEMLHRPRSRLLLVSEEESAITGFIVAQSLPPDFEIENVVVQPSLQRRGIGLQLVLASLRHAHSLGAVRILLEVRESNTAAQRLYRKAGFREDGRRVSYYRHPPEDAILYTLHLPAAKHNS